MGLLKSEYGRRYKNPSWQTYVAQYQEKIEYCTRRRQLEHRHQPFDWQDTDSDTTDDEASLPTKYDLPAKHDIPVTTCKHETHNLSVSTNIDKEAHVESEKRQPNAIVSGIKKPQSKNKKSRKFKKKKLCELAKAPLLSEPGKATLLSPLSEPSKAPLLSEPTKAPLLSELAKAPFIVYGWADDRRAVGMKQTHNVKACISNRTSVYPGALNAQMRRQLVEEEEARKRQKTDKTKVPKVRRYLHVVPPNDHWQTEYQRNFSR